jgi:hypothetical protein
MNEYDWEEEMGGRIGKRKGGWNRRGRNRRGIRREGRV